MHNFHECPKIKLFDIRQNTYIGIIKLALESPQDIDTLFLKIMDFLLGALLPKKKKLLMNKPTFQALLKPTWGTCET